MKKPESPCLGCDHRSPGCHGQCDGYQGYRTAWEEYKTTIYKARTDDVFQHLYQFEKKERIDKQFRRGRWDKKR